MKKEVEEKLFELASELGDPFEDSIDPEFEKSVMKDLRNVDGFHEYLRLTMSQDLKRYFAASNDTMRDQIKGHFSLAAYILGQMTKNSK